MIGNSYPANKAPLDLSIPKPVAEQLARDISAEETARIAADTALGKRIDWIGGDMGEFDHSELNERDADDAHPQSAITGLVDALALKADADDVDTALALKADADDVDTALALKAPLASPALTGTPTAPTPTFGDDSTKIATTEFVADAVALYPQSGYVPVGSVIAWPGSSIPTGWLLCNGQAHGSDDLQAVLGSANVPDYSETALVGAGTRASGVAVHDTFTVGQIKDDQGLNHTHQVYPYSGGDGATANHAASPTLSTRNVYSGTQFTVFSSAPDTGRWGTVNRGKRIGVNWIIRKE